jgi:hypothetical protein
MAIDTFFSISLAILFAQIVDLKDLENAKAYPSYAQIADDILDSLDEAHRDGSLKEEVKNNLDSYLIKDPESSARVLRSLNDMAKKYLS